MIVMMVMVVRMLMTVVVMMSVIGVEMLGIIVGVIAFGVSRFDVLPGMLLSVPFGMLFALMRLSRLRSIGARMFDDVALDALAIASAA